MAGRVTLGRRVRELRKAAGLTQRDLADTVGVDFTYLSKIENGRLESTPSIKTIQALAAALHVDDLELLQLADRLPPMLAGIGNSREALRFLREAAQTLKSDEDWRRMSRYLPSRRSRAK
jgi:transcriptional regulator with XRE-family HTH domain